MTKEKFNQLWNDIIQPAIEEYIKKNQSYNLECGLSGYEELNKSVYKYYEKHKSFFKDEYMKKYYKNIQADEECADTDDIRADRHKVAALIYLALTLQPSFVKLSPPRNENRIFDLVACHEIAYDVSLNCIESFINEEQGLNPNKHKQDFLNNKGFDKKPNLICEKYASYRESIIPRMVWATEQASRKFDFETTEQLREMRVATNANMLANIFYFLELHSAS